MRVHQILNFMKTKINCSQNRNSLDMTSFGSQQKVTNESDSQLISKEATEALKNKYMSNVSFSGTHRSIEMEESGHFESYVLTHTYGTAGTTYTTNEKRFVTDVFKARVAGSSYVAEGKYYDDVIRDAIMHSKDYSDDSSIKKNEHCYFYTCLPTPQEDSNGKGVSTGVGTIYFSDRNENVNPKVTEDSHYVVYASGAKDADEKPKQPPQEPPQQPVVRRKSLWEILFG